MYTINTVTSDDDDNDIHEHLIKIHNTSRNTSNNIRSYTSLSQGSRFSLRSRSTPPSQQQ